MNFDAKVRRESLDPIDLFYAHIGGMDAFARGLKIAAAIRQDGRLAEFVQRTLQFMGQRHWHENRVRQEQFRGDWKPTCSRKANRPATQSGRQEFLENLINEFV